jgi:hypothetical protein
MSQIQQVVDFLSHQPQLIMWWLIGIAVNPVNCVESVMFLCCTVTLGINSE